MNLRRKQERMTSQFLSRCVYCGDQLAALRSCLYVTPTDADPYMLWECPKCRTTRTIRLDPAAPVINLIEATEVPRLTPSPRPDGHMGWEYWKKFCNWLDIQD